MPEPIFFCLNFCFLWVSLGKFPATVRNHFSAHAVLMSAADVQFVRFHSLITLSFFPQKRKAGMNSKQVKS